jgi:hypothetical protein
MTVQSLFPINAEELVSDIIADLNKYVSLRPEYSATVVFWVLHTHLLDWSSITPRLGITAPEKRCGKSTLIDWLETVVHDGKKTDNITAAALFRLVTCPTLLIDEADTFLPSDELRGILNSGHKQGGTVERLEPRTGEIISYSTFAPCAIALIGALPGTLHDRSITIAMQRTKPRERLASLSMEGKSDLKSKIGRWCADLIPSPDPDIPLSLYNRVADNWRPLFAIADEVGGEWPNKLRDVALWIENRLESAELSEGEQLLNDIRENFGDREWLSSAEITRGLTLPMSSKMVAMKLKKYGIGPVQCRIDGVMQRGYWRIDFEDAWSRYVPSEPDVPDESQPGQSESGTSGSPEKRNADR